MQQGLIESTNGHQMQDSSFNLAIIPAKLEQMVKIFETHHCTIWILTIAFARQYTENQTELTWLLLLLLLIVIVVIDIIVIGVFSRNNEVCSSMLLLSPFAFLRQWQILHAYLIPEGGGGHGTEKLLTQTPPC
jgi:hypothetical protein